MRYLFFIFELVVILFAAGCVQQEPAESKINPVPPPNECKYDTCNGICYYNGSQTCCGGRLYNISDGICCAGIMHDQIKDMGSCCGGKWYVYGTKGECCPNPNGLTTLSQNYEQVWIDTSSQHCCAGKVAAGGKKAVKNPSYGEWKDCGNSCYDTSAQSCCMSEVQSNEWTSYDVRLSSLDPNNTLKVYEGLKRCCTHGYLKLCKEGMKCCYNDFGNSEATCKDPKSTDCDTYGHPPVCNSDFCTYTRWI